jgi:FdhD protein
MHIVPVSRRVLLVNWPADKSGTAGDRVAEEVPVALTYNKRSHVVMMATPDDLEDLAVGFSLTEGIIDGFADILGMRVLARENGLEVAMSVNEDCFSRLGRQRRNLTGRTGCGLCGTESLDQAARSPAAVGSEVSITAESIQRAVAALADHQPLQRVSGAAHGAAWCSAQGRIRLVREDVGRHNALDKLIGHLCRDGFRQGPGFALVSSRASYEMVYKSAAAGIEILVAVSAPTALAIEFAERCGMTLVGFARPGRHNVYSFHSRIRDDRTDDPGA